MLSEKVWLTSASLALRPLCGGVAPGYRKLYGMIVDGEMPEAHRDERTNRYYFNRCDMQAVAERVKSKVDRRFRSYRMEPVAA